MPRSSTHRYTFTLSDEAEDGTVLHEAECRITYTFHPSRPATAPSYASGGDPPEPALAEWTKIEVEDARIDGSMGWAPAVEPLLSRLIDWCEDDKNRALLVEHAEQECRDRYAA